jgi:hypothetical protein
MKTVSIACLATALSFSSFVVGQEVHLLVPSQTVTLPLVQGGFNHMSVDARHMRLFATAPTNRTLEVIDLRSGKPLPSLEGEKPAAALRSEERRVGKEC